MISSESTPPEPVSRQMNRRRFFTVSSAAAATAFLAACGSKSES